MEHKLNLSFNGGFNMRFYAALDGKAQPPYVYPHHIENEVEIFLLVDGDVSFAVESRVYKMSRGDVIVTKPNEMHHCIRNTSTVNHHYCFHFDPTCNRVFSDFLEHAYGCDNLVSLPPQEKEALLTLAHRINDAFLRGEDALEKLSPTLEMLSLIKRNLGVASTFQKLPKVLERILAVIDERLCEIDSFDDICEEFFISRSTLGRLFKRYLATTPRGYLEGKRLTVARRLLSKGESVGDTCRAVGFSNVSSFIRLFKRRFGETPLKYSQNK